MPSRAASSARGGRSSAAKTGEPERRAVRRSGTGADTFNWEFRIENLHWNGGRLVAHAYSDIVDFQFVNCKLRESPPLARAAVSLEHLVDQEQIGEQRPQVNRRVQVVDQLRADGRLRQDQLHGGPGVAGIAFEHGDEGGVRGWIDVQLRDEAGEKRAQVRERLIALAQELADLTVALIAREPLRRIREQELVALIRSRRSALLSSERASSRVGDAASGLTRGSPAALCPGSPSSAADRGARDRAAAGSTRRSCPW